MPIAGWVAADKLGTAVTGQPLTTRFRQDVAAKGAPLVYPPDVTDSAVYQDEFVAWLEGTFPTAHADPSRAIFYSLDNEPDLWCDTHSRFTPSRSPTPSCCPRASAYATAIKAVAPQARIFGPVSYGYNGFISLQDATDASGPRLPRVLPRSGMSAASTTAGQRLLDVLDLHWYPEAQGGGVRVTGEDTTAAAVAAARVQAPRSLWDPTYVETSWITQFAGQPAHPADSRGEGEDRRPLPGHRARRSPSTTTAAAATSPGRSPQADVLGIFGRDGVFAAALWDLPGGTSFQDAALAAYTDFDGAGGRFGDTSIEASTSDDAASSVYASVDEGRDDRLVLVAINKTAAPLVAQLQLSHPVVLTRGQTWQLTSAAPALRRGPALAATGRNAFRLELPASSVTTAVLTP